MKLEKPLLQWVTIAWIWSWLSSVWDLIQNCPKRALYWISVELCRYAGITYITSCTPVWPLNVPLSFALLRFTLQTTTGATSPPLHLPRSALLRTWQVCVHLHECFLLLFFFVWRDVLVCCRSCGAICWLRTVITLGFFFQKANTAVNAVQLLDKTNMFFSYQSNKLQTWINNK